MTAFCSIISEFCWVFLAYNSQNLVFISSFSNWDVYNLYLSTESSFWSFSIILAFLSYLIPISIFSFSTFFFPTWFSSNSLVIFSISFSSYCLYSSIFLFSTNKLSKFSLISRYFPSVSIIWSSYVFACLFQVSNSLYNSEIKV